MPTIVNLDGPLPVKATFQTMSNGRTTLFVAGSVWSAQTDVLIGVSVTADSGPVGDIEIWSNGPETHRACVPGYFEIDLDKAPPSPDVAPTYTVELSAKNSSSIGDLNDRYTVVLFD